MMLTNRQLPQLTTIPINGGVYDQMRTTIKVIGDAIRRGSLYLPIRNRAAALASKADSKDYAGQVSEIFSDFVKRWKYVKDPVGKELVTTSPEQIFHLVMGGTSADPGAGFGIGVGDCDDATVAIGAQLQSIGIPVRIATIAPEGAPKGRLMSHVFCQANVPGMGWVTVDPVVHPTNGVFYTPPNSRLAAFNLDGKFLGGSGNLQNMSGLAGLSENREATKMHVNDFQDLSGPDDFSGIGGMPQDFRKFAIKDFGIYADSMGILDLGDCNIGLAAEATVDRHGRAQTPILELQPRDYSYIKRVGYPLHGMLALGDDLEVYQYDSGLGFFKKLFKKVRKKVNKVRKKIRSVAKKLLKKIPGGKALLKLGKKIWKVSKKLLRPLTKFVGKYAKKLAPIAALIPGYGPAIAAGLHMSGRIANIMNKHGVKVLSKKGDKVGKLRFKSDKAAKAFKMDLKKAAKAEKRKGGSLNKKKGRSMKRTMRPRGVGRKMRGGRRPVRRRAA